MYSRPFVSVGFAYMDSTNHDEKYLGWEFPGGPVARTPPHLDFNPWSADLRSCKPLGAAKKIKNWGKKTSENSKAKLEFALHQEWHPTPVLLPGKSYGRRSLVAW